jgi:uncharacterized membrane protein YgdD (TMEM256/DUF423 family)
VKLLSLILRELVGLFLDDEFLAVAALAVVAVAAAAAWLAAPSLLVGSVLLIGSLFVLTVSVLRAR